MSEPLEPPTEPGMVRYSVEVMPHAWATEGLAWETGTQAPADVARALRSIADQVEYFTPPAADRREGGAVWADSTPVGATQENPRPIPSDIRVAGQVESNEDQWGDQAGVVL